MCFHFVKMVKEMKWWQNVKWWGRWLVNLLYVVGDKYQVVVPVAA
jgi:hypothetical protein